MSVFSEFLSLLISQRKRNCLRGKETTSPGLPLETLEASPPLAPALTLLSSSTPASWLALYQSVPLYLLEYFYVFYAFDDVLCSLQAGAISLTCVSPCCAQNMGLDIRRASKCHSFRHQGDWNFSQHRFCKPRPI